MATGPANETRLEAIVLAAGSGSRFGGGKLLAPWRGGVLLDGALAAAFAAPVRTVTVVTGADADRVATAARAFAETAGQTGRLRLVHAPDHAEGMAATLRTGIGVLPADTQAVFVFLGDMPAVPHAVLPGLAEALTGADAAAPVFDSRRGHPALIGAALFPALHALRGDEGARKVLAGLGDRLVLVQAPDDGVLLDIDRPGDLDGLATR